MLHEGTRVSGSQWRLGFGASESVCGERPDLTAILTATPWELHAMNGYEQVFVVDSPLYFLTP